MAEEKEDAAPASDPTSAAAPPPSAAAAPAAPISDKPVEAATPVSTSVPGSAGGAAAPARTLKESLQSMGLDLARFQSEDQAAQYIAQAIQQGYQAQQLAKYGQEVMPHWDKFQSWLKDQEAGGKRQETEQPWDKKYWPAPEYDDSWEAFLEVNEHGQVVPRAGAPVHLAQKAIEYRQFRAREADKLMRNIPQYLRPIVEDLAGQVAEKKIQEHLGQYKDQVFSTDFIGRNSNWLFQKDKDGADLYEPASGRRLLSPWGQRFMTHLADAEKRFGLKDVRLQQEWALAQVELDWRRQESGAGNQELGGRENANKQALAAAANPAVARANQAAPSQDMTGLTLRERLQKAFTQNGIDDQYFINEFRK